MTIPLPNLDDRRWLDLVEEGRALIPLCAPGWTDHNAHCPGITLMELLAYVTEARLYHGNRVPDRHRLKFLALTQIEPRPPIPARGVVQVRPKPAPTTDSTPLLTLPAATELQAGGADQPATTFRLLEDLTVLPVELGAVQVETSSGFRDVSEAYLAAQGGGSARPAIFGESPEIGAAFYLALAIPDARAFDQPLRLHLCFADARARYAERLRLREEYAERRRICDELHSNPCEEQGSDSQEMPPEPGTEPPLHHSAVTVWEYAATGGDGSVWQPLRSRDETRSMTLDGPVTVWLPKDADKRSVGLVKQSLYYIRCRLASWTFDAPPVLEHVLSNAAAIEQSRQEIGTWRFATGATVTGPVPTPGSRLQFDWTLNAAGRITALEFRPAPAAGAPGLALVEYRPVSATDTGWLALDAVLLGRSDASPNQTFAIGNGPAVASSVEVLVLNQGDWRAWRRRPDLDASAADDADFVLSDDANEIRFGDGRNGLVPPKGSYLFARIRVTRAEAGNPPVGTELLLSESPRNRSLLEDPSDAQSRLEFARIGAVSERGEVAETLSHAIGRAIERRETSWRAVTLEDFERLALATPGTRIARVLAKPATHPSFDCAKAPGVVMLVIVPDMPGRRPSPSIGLRQAVQSYVDRRRIVGTRVVVTGPRFVEVRVRASVTACAGVDRQRLTARLTQALDAFFDPLRGGPQKSGWPLGRNVYVSEVMDEIHRVAGVDHVAELALVAGDCEPQCGNICLRPNELVTSGDHRMTML